MLFVLMVIDPFQVPHGVVLHVAIEMIDLRLVVRIIEECFRNKSMHLLMVSFSIKEDVNSEVSLTVDFRVHWLMSVSRSDPAIGADLVVRKALDFYPYLSSKIHSLTSVSAIFI